MRIESISLPVNNPLIADYKNNFKKIEDKFEYNPSDGHVWKQRSDYISSHTYNRDGLVEVLTALNDRYGASEPVFANINKLKKEQASVVVGGQQAGLLTGPLYTVHKIISILQLARQQEADLGVPVVPLFWIAGEDHDFAEINHIFLNKNKKMEKIQAETSVNERKSITDLEFNQKDIENWLGTVFHNLNETEYSLALYHRLKEMIQSSGSYSDFFGKLIHQLFPSEGLILLDAHDPEIRKLESRYFAEMIEHNEEIAEGVYSMEQKNKQQGYPLELDTSIEDAHLFYHDQGERVLLVRNETGGYTGKKGEITLTKQQLMTTAENQPWLLSNNVVTRPLMQECLLPVLAFIGGPGEITYWSALKPGFDALNLEMPPVVPRLSFTLLDKKSEQRLDRLEIDMKEAVEEGTVGRKLSWLSSTGVPPLNDLAEEVKKEMETIHQPLKQKAAELSPELGELAQKNLKYIHQSVEFLEKRMNKHLEDKYRDQLAVFDELNLLLHPNNGLQERMWSVVPWLNNYGMALFAELNARQLTFESGHYVVKV
ncbi:bacillithiol biosynthesis cysteine-adding enzyme BshC [Halobacillus sp. A5]|uniref:bacillithiol biosynthesis cysteine-adding enzyme BshC n=1 Tax=Halobacillus sp. A5 TaxID=2880263 RepID=UPI0020A630D0|nr:bacillithiol biosynthesis cysteine-adding enzyme BshC [Halobacillus sp. A5]MCP3026217.1 bacillithiol biosynthesis cysteine-adding enzyme BshC [Halobacillus sp. A5]